MRQRRPVLWATMLIAAFLLFSVLVGIVYEDIMQKREYEKNYQLMQDELVSSGLVSEQLELERKIKLLADKESKRVPTVTFLYKTPDRLVYDAIMPEMSRFGMTGTVCISPGSLPGMGGNITLDEYRLMLAFGYSSAVHYDGSVSLGDYLSELKGKADSLNIPFPATLYVSGSVENKPYYMFEYDEKGKPIFTNEIKAVLEQYGIGCVVQETYQSKIVSYQNFYEPLTYCESLGYVCEKKLSKESFLETLKTRGSLVFSVQFDRENSFGRYYERYDPTDKLSDPNFSEQYRRMLDTISDYGDGIKVIDIPAVSKYRNEFNSELELDFETDAALNELESRLEAVKAEIAAIKAKYGE